MKKIVSIFAISALFLSINANAQQSPKQKKPVLLKKKNHVQPKRKNLVELKKKQDVVLLKKLKRSLIFY